jgi:hypothetical protein
MTEREGPDSFMQGAVAVAKSSKGRAIGSWLVRWLLLPAFTLVGGWLTHAWQLGDRVDRRLAAIDAVIGTEMLLNQKDPKKSLFEMVQRIDLNVLEGGSKEQRHLLQVGRQTAYATACCETAEPKRALDAKRKDATSEAAKYERMVIKGTDPEDAYTTLFSP